MHGSLPDDVHNPSKRQRLSSEEIETLADEANAVALAEKQNSEIIDIPRIPLVVNLDPREWACLQAVVAKLKPRFFTEEDFVGYLFSSTAQEGMSGESFTKFGFELAYLLNLSNAKRNKGGVK